MDFALRRGVAAAVKALQDSPNTCGLLSYSLGGIVASLILEGARAGVYTNIDDSPLDIAFAVNIANPLRQAGESVGNLCPAKSFGLHGQRGHWPVAVDVREYANPHDIITCTPADSPLRVLDPALSPFALLEGARIGTLAPQPDSQHMLYASHTMPGADVPWTTHAADYLNTNY
ncbi:hypothetical protein [Nocardia sp. NPDC020380]|uniref:hypothetical protein n=1 Tax=Nocardia sp. NPDC020380 TaxID=3364309 RepID=UPI00379F9310